MRNTTKLQDSRFAKHTDKEDGYLHKLILEVCRKCFAVSDDAPQRERRYAELLALVKAEQICKEFDEDDGVDASAYYILTKKKVMI